MIIKSQLNNKIKTNQTYFGHMSKDSKIDDVNNCTQLIRFFQFCFKSSPLSSLVGSTLIENVSYQIKEREKERVRGWMGEVPRRAC